jgi:K+-sensing histidine kinase KdpD
MVMSTSNQRLLPHSLFAVRTILPYISHELRTPLTAIKGFAALLLRYQERLHATEQHDMLDEITLACERLEKTIAQILQISEMIAGQITFAPVTLNLARLLQEAAVAVEQHYADAMADASLRVSITNSELCSISGDPRYLDSLLVELLEFVHSLSPQNRSIAVTLRRWPDSDRLSLMRGERQWWEIQIPLDGGDTSLESLPFLYHSCENDRDLSTDEAYRSGLTLADCGLIAALHGGLLWIDGLADHDHTLHLVLPALS